MVENVDEQVDLGSLRKLMNQIYRIEEKMGGIWVTEENAAFAELHSHVSDAYRSYNDGPPFDLFWMDPESGEAVPEAEGAPAGMGAELGDVILRAIGIGHRLGLDMARVLVDMMRGYDSLMQRATADWTVVDDVAESAMDDAAESTTAGGMDGGEVSETIAGGVEPEQK